jgi:hypothetical protein
MLNRLLRFVESRGFTVRFVERCKLNGAAGTSKTASLLPCWHFEKYDFENFVTA